MRTFLIILIWLIANNQHFIVGKSMVINSAIDPAIDYFTDIVSRNVVEEKIDNERLVKEWQDWVLANPIVVNYLNSLMVLASRQDFAFIIPLGYSVKCIKNIGSFRQTISQLALEMRTAIGGAREDLNRVHIGMERVPTELKNILVYMKIAPFEFLLMSFPDSFKEIEKIVNDSLVVLSKPGKAFQQVLNLLTEIDHLLTSATSDLIISWQIKDIKIQWTCLTELIIELSKRAKTTSDAFLLQFNWILNEFIRPEMTLADSHRDFMIALLLPKIIEIDQTSDLLGIITIAYTDISFQYTDEQIGGNGHLLLLPNEDIRKRYLKQFRYELLPQVIQSARIALDRHTKFLRRDRNRKKDYDKLLASISINDLVDLLG
ncbi:hypothetical protein I4U23_029553 [Adineta vaga]|nr:hypothetical protein I4U23_029553 [Adineta vaga]